MIDIFNELNEFGVSCDVVDPLVDKEELAQEYGIQTVDLHPDFSAKKEYSAIIFAVSHRELVDHFKPYVIRECLQDGGVVFDVKNVLDVSEVRALGINYLSL